MKNTDGVKENYNKNFPAENNGICVQTSKKFNYLELNQEFMDVKLCSVVYKHQILEWFQNMLQRNPISTLSIEENF